MFAPVCVHQAVALVTLESDRDLLRVGKCSNSVSRVVGRSAGDQWRVAGVLSQMAFDYSSNAF